MEGLDFKDKYNHDRKGCYKDMRLANIFGKIKDRGEEAAVCYMDLWLLASFNHSTNVDKKLVQCVTDDAASFDCDWPGVSQDPGLL